jgi:hypothetical protein
MLLSPLSNSMSHRALRSVSSRRRRTRRKSVRFLPGVASLEVRALLSTITVTNDADNGSGSLRAALQSAVAGDTIDFARSAYGTITLSSGPLEVTTNVTIDGPGAKNLTINGNNTYQDLVVEAGVTATVSGVTFTGGEAPANSFYGGGGIFNAGTLTVANCVITGNSGEAGAGISNSGNLTVERSVVSDNSAEFSAGIANSPLAILNISGSTITNNVAQDLCGGIGNYLGSVKISNSVISDNSAQSGGGGICDTRGSNGTGGTMTIMNSDISGNKAGSENGGGIMVYGGALTLVGSTLQNNTVGSSTAGFAAGGAVAENGSATVNISGCLFAQNQAQSGTPYGEVDGGAVFALNYGFSAATLNISDSTFIGNTASGAYAAYGGAVHVDYGVNVSVTATSFTGNTATAGGYVEGGAIDVEQSEFGFFQTQATITGCSFQGNAATIPATTPFPLSANTNGGALFVRGPTTVSGTTFTANQANGGYAFGGAIANSFGFSTLDVSNCLLVNNTAIGGPNGGLAAGGGLETEFGTTTVTVNNTSFLGNQAIGGPASGAGNTGGGGWGGGIQIEDSTVTLTGCTLAANVAQGGAGTDGATGGNGEGGAIQSQGTITVSNSSVTLNEAKGGAGGGNGYGGGNYSFGTTTLTDALVSLNVAAGGSDGGQGVGGGLYIAFGTTTLTGKTQVVLNLATTADDNIYGTYST